MQNIQNNKECLIRSREIINGQKYETTSRNMFKDARNAIMIIVNWFTKMIQLKTTTIAILSEKIARIYRNDIWKIYKVSKKILSDK